MDLINNPWIIGVGGGILSGLVVTLITRSIFSRRENKENAQRASQANHEVLYAIRPGISEGVIPDNGVINSLISATARKYGVDAVDMHDLNAVSSELIKEVMDSSFISAQAKQEFCEKLVSIKEVEAEFEKPEIEVDYQQASKYRRQMTFMMGTMAGVMTGIAGFVIGFKGDELADSKKVLFLVIPAAVAILAAVLSVLMKELERLKLKRLDFRLGGFKAEFGPKDAQNKEKDA